jgi:hypothetical protein
MRGRQNPQTPSPRQQARLAAPAPRFAMHNRRAKLQPEAAWRFIAAAIA